MDWEFEQAKREFANSGLSIKELLYQRGWKSVPAVNEIAQWCPPNKPLEAAMSENQALELVLLTWYDN
jgi:hypothetical protein